ncbi:MAG: hypothetical protein PUF46_04215 [Oscillospiraceae bacterium]|nr:hypothetical protein [Oscillospiraceae bacterium]
MHITENGKISLPGATFSPAAASDEWLQEILRIPSSNLKRPRIDKDRELWYFIDCTNVSNTDITKICRTGTEIIPEAK